MPGEGEGEGRCLFFHYKGRANKETGTKSLRGLSYLTRGGLEEEIDRSTGEGGGYRLLFIFARFKQRSVFDFEIALLADTRRGILRSGSRSLGKYIYIWWIMKRKRTKIWFRNRFVSTTGVRSLSMFRSCNQ